MDGKLPQRVTLNDKYVLEQKRVFLSGRQALVRLPLEQRKLDRDRGLNTAGFISGYRGSPLGGYDSELWKVRELLEQHDILFQPGTNEDLAATAVWGTQQLGFLPGRKVEGVFSIWYGKGPGVDRSGDPFKHANLQGVEPHGGVLLVFGDDHAGKSSSTAHQSDLALAAHEIPVLYPASVREIIEYGLAGFALSRYSGLLVGLKLVNETAELSSIVTLDEHGSRFIEPELAGPPGGVHIRKEFVSFQEQDARLVRYKLPRAQAFVRANGLDRIVFGAPHARFVVVTAGKAYADVLGALELLGVDEAAARLIGLAIYKVAMIYPLEPQGLCTATAQAEEIFVVEEKRPHLESQAARALLNLPRHPRLSGKADPDGRSLLPADAQLDALTVAHALAQRLSAVVTNLLDLVPDLAARMEAFRARLASAASTIPSPLMRRPAFCAGCPHSISTVVPDGSFGMTGIGCHSMAVFLGNRNPLPVTHMGGEGATWLGLAPFTSTAHIFQNLGDGTYNHSGSMAIRAAVQARANITYKILYNDAVAMTGGQPVEGHPTVSRIAAQVLAEGVARVIVVAEQPERFHAHEKLPSSVEVRHRDDLNTVQKTLRDTPGVTVLIYDQTCAAEKRRRRKRGEYPDPNRRIFINHRVCEGCGDCSVQSSCLAIQPLETELGRKRVIDQSACNKDFSCSKGFCPSFVTVENAKLLRNRTAPPESLLDSIPHPRVPPLTEKSTIMVVGVGGTGVVTISAIVGMAAHLEGRGAHLYDMTGLSQKGGAVFSHVKLAIDPCKVTPARIGAGEADVILACDAVAATHREALQTIDADRTVVVVNSDVTATASLQSDPDVSFDLEPLLDVLRRASGDRTPHRFPASTLATRLLGDSIASNMMMLGFAWQHGLIPLSHSAIERAIELNGVAVSSNIMAFKLGRVAAVYPDKLREYASDKPAADEEPGRDLDTFARRRTEDLTAYWNARYAAAYAGLVERARQREAELALDTDAFSWAVARAAFKLMAYKDEYEVGRLYSDGQFRLSLQRLFASGYRLTFHLAPPLWSPMDPRTGRPRKATFGAWIMPLFHVLARIKGLRETPFDIFGWSAERRMERQVRDEYLALIPTLCAQLTATNHASFVALAEAPQKVRGFGPVKAPAAAELLAKMRSANAGV